MADSFTEISYCCAKPLLNLTEEQNTLLNFQKIIAADLCKKFEEKNPEVACKESSPEMIEYYRLRNQFKHDQIKNAYKDGFKQFIEIGTGFIPASADYSLNMRSARFHDFDLPELADFANENSRLVKRNKISHINLLDKDFTKSFDAAGVSNRLPTFVSVIGVLTYFEFDKAQEILKKINNHFPNSRILTNFIENKEDKLKHNLDNGLGVGFELNYKNLTSLCEKTGYKLSGDTSVFDLLMKNRDSVNTPINDLANLSNYILTVLDSKNKKIEGPSLLINRARGNIEIS